VTTSLLLLPPPPHPARMGVAVAASNDIEKTVEDRRRRV
jgi:hypothetical protein